MDSSLFKEIKVKAGEPINVKLPVTGSPSPVVTWSKDGELLANRFVAKQALDNMPVC
jgi:hypothetical protein